MAIKTARELALLPYAKRTVAERLGGRGGRGGGRGGPVGRAVPAGPASEEQQPEAAAGAEDVATVEASTPRSRSIEDLEVERPTLATTETRQ